jgi:hypothetical protein
VLGLQKNLNKSEVKVMKKLATAFMLVLGMVLLIMNHQLKQKQVAHNLRIEKIRQDKANYMFDVVLPVINIEADLLVKKTKQEIINSFEKDYPNKTELKKELLDNLNGRSEYSHAIAEVGNIIQGVTLNDVPLTQADNNDLIILMRNPEKNEYVITIDMSENCAVEDRFRNAEIEGNQQFSKALFLKAYDDFAKNISPTFWSFLPVANDKLWHEEVKNMDSTSFKDLKAYYIKHNTNNESLASFEILVSDKIYRYTDYFGEDSKNPNGSYTNEDLTIVVISGYNILDQLELKHKMQTELNSYDGNITVESERFQVYKAQNEIFSIIIIIAFIMLFLYAHDHTTKR